MLFLVTCNKKSEIYWQAKNATQFENKCSLKSKGLRKFQINDSTALSYIPSIQILRKSDPNLLYFYNSFSNAIYVYSLSSDTLVKHIDFRTNGPNGILPKHTNHAILKSKDSVFIYDRTKQAFKFFKGNELWKKISLNQLKVRDSLLFLPVWQPSLYEKFLVKNEYLFISIHQYLSSHEINQEIIHSALRINYKTDSAKSYLPLPELYKEGNWGKQSAVKTHLFLSPGINNTMYYSFASDPFIYQYKNTNPLGKKFLGSKEFKKVLPLNRKRKNTPKEVSWRYSSTTPEYFMHRFDPQSKLFFRFSTLPNKPEDYNKGKKWPGFTIIIADSSFTKIGEEVFEKPVGWKKYAPRYSFCHNGKLYLFRRDLYNEDGNHLYFEEFEIQYHEEKQN